MININELDFSSIVFFALKYDGLRVERKFTVIFENIEGQKRIDVDDNLFIEKFTSLVPNIESSFLEVFYGLNELCWNQHGLKIVTLLSYNRNKNGKYEFIKILDKKTEIIDNKSLDKLLEV